MIPRFLFVFTEVTVIQLPFPFLYGAYIQQLESSVGHMLNIRSGSFQSRKDRVNSNVDQGKTRLGPAATSISLVKHSQVILSSE